MGKNVRFWLCCVAVCGVMVAVGGVASATETVRMSYSALSCFRAGADGSSVGFNEAHGLGHFATSGAGAETVYCPVTYVRELEFDGISQEFDPSDDISTVLVYVNDQTADDAVSCRLCGADGGASSGEFLYCCLSEQSSHDSDADTGRDYFSFDATDLGGVLFNGYYDEYLWLVCQMPCYDDDELPSGIMGYYSIFQQ